MAPERPDGSADPARSEERSTAPADPIGERFPRSCRLTRGEDYRLVFSKGDRIGGPHLALHLRRSTLANARLGLAVPRSVGNAVVRNRVKRRLRDIFRRDLRARLDAGPGAHDVVIRVREGAGGLSRAELEAEILELLGRWRTRLRRDRARRRSPSS